MHIGFVSFIFAIFFIYFFCVRWFGKPCIGFVLVLFI
uniref:Uncharacterized protein n=1 Tax=Arundo donax TaxID=35708 RepID=A0A0A9AQZ3_ARUDO